jgi:hypothetical protein
MIMDITTWFLLLGGVCLLLPFGWFVGRLQDLTQRCKWMRQFTKKDYRLVKFKYPGTNINLFARIIDLSKYGSTVIIGSQQWVITKDRMYLEKNEKVGISIPKINENPEYDEGCPVIFLDAEHCTPLGFVGDDIKVNPEELGSTYDGYFLNQERKLLLSIKNIKTMMMLMVGLAALCCIFSYMAHTDTAVNKQELDGIQGMMNSSKCFTPVPGPITSGNQTVIKQGG